jgi:hypothetical protein
METLHHATPSHTARFIPGQTTRWSGLIRRQTISEFDGGADGDGAETVRAVVGYRAVGGGGAHRLRLGVRVLIGICH